MTGFSNMVTMAMVTMVVVHVYVDGRHGDHLLVLTGNPLLLGPPSHITRITSGSRTFSLHDKQSCNTWSVWFHQNGHSPQPENQLKVTWLKQCFSHRIENFY